MASSNGLQIPALPPSLKPIGHQVKVAAEHANRDPVITYWCRVSALQAGMKLDKSSKEAMAVLLPLMDWLEKEKKVMKDNEAVAHEVVGQAHVENYAMKLFQWADKEDRASRFNKNVVKAFYNSGVIFDIMTVFGDLTPENEQIRKYAKWKAAYIHNCLKNGETPVPGPAGGEDAPQAPVEGAAGGWEVPQIGDIQPPSATAGQQPSPMPDTTILEDAKPQPAPRTRSPAAQPTAPAAAVPANPSQAGNVQLDSKQIAQAKKLCNHASSALDYDDITTAKDNLMKALTLLNTGQC